MSANCVPAIAASSSSGESIAFLGVRINLMTSGRLLDLVADCISAQRKVIIAHHNLHSLCLHKGSGDEAVSFRRFYDDTHYTLADGMAVVLIGKLLGQRIGVEHRIAYNDWLPVMLPAAVKSGWRIFYLGSTPEAAVKGAEVLRAKFSGLQLKVHHGHFDAQYESDSNSRVIAEICEYEPHMLFVGMGMPRQERWIQENLDALNVNVILPSGATLDYIAGVKKMAPRWMGRLGLEWAFRLATEPRRLAFRYLIEPWGLVRAVVLNSLDRPADGEALRTENTE